MPGHLITNLKSKDFMGCSLDELIRQKTIYTGKNTIGKSTRANIIAITALGFSPFSTKTSKKPADILNDFGNGKKMVTEFTCGGVIFERKFTRNSKGAVSNKTRVNKTGANVAEFAVALANAGNPQIIDLGAFLKLSDNEKINTLFKLYPPNADLSNLDSDIEKSKKKISRLNESKGNTEGAISKLIESKTAIQLPAGTLAETRADIENLTKGVLEAKKALKTAEKKNAVELLAEQKVNSQDTFDKEMKKNSPPYDDANHQELKIVNQKLDNKSDYFVTGTGHHDPETFGLGIINHPAESIQKIIDAMKKTNCGMCAAKMVALVELRKYKGQ